MVDITREGFTFPIVRQLEDGLFYYQDETNCYDGNGPFATVKEALDAFEDYLLHL